MTIATATQVAERTSVRITETLFMEWLNTRAGHDQLAHLVRLAKSGNLQTLKDEEVKLHLQAVVGKEYVRATGEELFPKRERQLPGVEGLSESLVKEDLGFWLTARLGLSPYLARPLMERLDGRRDRLEDLISRAALTEKDRLAAFYGVVASDLKRGISKADLRHFVRAVLDEYPRLSFFRAQGTSACKEQYVETVVTRIFHVHGFETSPHLTLRQLRKVARKCHQSSEGVSEIWRRLDDDRGPFCYEQFYVLFFLFWELDVNKAGKLTPDDLLGYAGLSETFVKEHLFGRRRKALEFSDFVEFLLSFQDVTTARSVEYLCRLLDVSHDGKLRRKDLTKIYADFGAVDRTPSFRDLLSQFWETLSIRTDNCHAGDWYIQWKDLLEDSKRPIAGLFLSIIISRHKLASFEQRDPYSERQERLENAHWTDWDRFCHKEYCRIVNLSSK